MNQSLTVKHDENNYLIWKNQLLNIIIANGLKDFIDGTRPSSPLFSYPTQRLLNPDYTTWHRFNKLIMSWFYVSITKGMMGQIVGFNTVFEIWEALNQIYSTAMMARLIELRAQTSDLEVVLHQWNTPKR